MHKGALNPKAIWAANPTKLRGLMGQLEKCPTSGKLHWQIYFELKTRGYATSVNKIFKSGQWTTVLAKGTAEQNRKYTGKEATAQKDPEHPDEDSHFEFGDFALAGKSSKLTEIEKLVHDGVRERALWKTHFSTMVIHHKGIIRGLSILNAPVDKALFAQDKFDFKMQEIDWTKTQVFWGGSGIGKTQFALSLFKSPMLVSHMDQLGAFDPEDYDGIVFDDMNWQGDAETGKGKWKDGAQIHLVDQDNNRAIHIRYAVALIPAHTKKVITTNVHNGAVLNWGCEAIARRCQVHELEAFEFF